MEAIESAKPIGFRPRGTLGLFHNAKQRATAERIFGASGRLAGAGELLTAEQVFKIEPMVQEIDGTSVVGGILHKKGATVDPWSLCAALKDQILQNHGVVRCSFHVASIDALADGRFRVVGQTKDGTKHTIVANQVLNCTGWQASQLDPKVAVEPIHGQMAAFYLPGKRLNHNLYSWEALTDWHSQKRKHRCTLDPDSLQRNTRHFYGLQLENGMFKFGGDRIKGDHDGKVFLDGISTSVSQTHEILPVMKDAAVIGSWSGSMPFTPDQKIIMGETEPNLFVLTGSGFMRGLAAGTALGHLVCGTNHGLTDAMIAECDPHRFEEEASRRK